MKRIPKPIRFTLISFAAISALLLTILFIKHEVQNLIQGGIKQTKGKETRREVSGLFGTSANHK